MLVAGPNLTIDRTLSLPELRPGNVMRCEDVKVTPGGKGLNVGRAGRDLGLRALLVSFVPGHTGRAAAALIAEEGIDLRSVGCRGELRSTAIFIESGGRTTVVNEPGPALAPGDWERYESALARELGDHGLLVCSGSVPPGSPNGAYARLVELARDADRRCVIDANGDVLAAALAAGPDVVTPNLAEAEGLLGIARAGEAVEAAADAQPRALSAATALLELGARAAVVTAAAAGAAVAAPGEPPAWLPAPRVEAVRNPIGAGDVLTATVAAALERGRTLVDAARAGVAAAAASVEVPTAGEVDLARARELLGRPSA